MTSTKRIFLGAAWLAALTCQGAFYDFTGGVASTNGWQPYSPLAPFGVASTASDGPAGYRLQSAPSVMPSVLGPARVGSLLPVSMGNFALSFDVPTYSATPTEYFGAAARMGTVGLGTSSGYAFGYDNSVGGLLISKIVGEALQGAIGPGAAAAVWLVPGQGYRFTFEGLGASFDGAVYSLSDLTTPLATVFGSDSSFSSGQFGLLVASQAQTGPADQTFGRFSLNAIPEPTTATLAVLGGLMAWGLSGWRRLRR